MPDQQCWRHNQTLQQMPENIAALFNIRAVLVSFRVCGTSHRTEVRVLTPGIAKPEVRRRKRAGNR
jgi:hypothetical protein